MSITRAGRAYAKVNLALAVGPPVPGHGPRSGWHRIASWMHAVDLFDDIEVAPAEPGEGGEPHLPEHFDLRWADDAPLHAGEAFAWSLADDLVVKAIKALEANARRPLPTRVKIRKRIPDGGGLGGGSADAATVLRLASELHGLRLDAAAFSEAAASVGSDVTFFIDHEADTSAPPRPALVDGFGDRLSRMSRAGGEIVLILPPFGCPTGKVYRDYDEHLRRDRRGFDRERIHEASGVGVALPELCMNDLTHAAVRIEPRLAGVIERAEAVAGEDRVRMSGSGSTLFVLCAEGQSGPLVEELGRVLRGDGATVVASRLV